MSQDSTNLEAIKFENLVLGSILCGETKYLDELDTKHFYSEFNKGLMAEMKTKYFEGEPIDIVSLGTKFDYSTLSHLSDQGMAYSYNSYYSSKIKSYYNKRFVIDEINDLKEKVSTTEDLEGLLINFGLTADEILKNGDTTAKHISEVAKEFIIDMDVPVDKKKIEQYRTGIDIIDRLMVCMQPNELTLIGARSGVGKTAFDLQIATRQAKMGLRTGFVTREMKDRQLFNRMLISLTGILNTKLRTKEFTPYEYQMLKNAARHLEQYNLFIDSNSSTISNVFRMVKENDLQILHVDYAQLMEGRTKTSREREVASISRDLQRLSCKFSIPVGLLSQLNDKSGDSRPMGERDLRESAALWQDSANVIFLHRPNDSEYKKHVERGTCSEAERDPSLNTKYQPIEVFLAKQRDGLTGLSVMNYYNSELKFDKRDGDGQYYYDLLMRNR